MDLAQVDDVAVVFVVGGFPVRHEEPEDEIDPEVDVDEKLEEVPRPVGVHVETDAIGDGEGDV